MILQHPGFSSGKQTYFLASSVKWRVPAETKVRFDSQTHCQRKEDDQENKMDTMDQNKYREKSRPAKEGCQYESTPRLNDPDCALCLDSLRKARCVPIHNVEKVCTIKPQNYYVPSPYKMDDATTYKSHFFHKVVEKQSSFRPIPKLVKVAGTMSGASEYGTNYLRHAVNPVQKANWVKMREYQEPMGTISGVSSYKAAYQPLMYAPAKMYRPQSYRGPSREAMDFQTSYQTCFVPYDQPKVCSMKPVEEIVEREIPAFTGMTLYQTSYFKHFGNRKTKSAKAKYRYPRVDFEFELESTYGGAYRPFVFQKCDNTPKRNCYIFNDLSL